jgi:hypothetical protein
MVICIGYNKGRELTQVETRFCVLYGSYYCCNVSIRYNEIRSTSELKQQIDGARMNYSFKIWGSSLSSLKILNLCISCKKCAIVSIL